MNNEKAPLLEMRNIKKDFFGNQVLTDINLKLNEGDVLGLCGENGAGKSTLMKILFGASDITSTGGYGGDILIDGQKVSFASPFEAIAAGIGMVHQEFSLIPGFDATENILLNREPKKGNVVSEVFGDRLDTLDRREMDDRAKAAIEKMGVSIDQHMMINSMPVGHKQFTEIARELSKEQLRILILDEPTAVLTEKEAEALLDSIRGMSARGITVIFITHRLHEILSVCNKVAVMRDGVLVQEVPASETSVEQITHWMVGRDVKGGGAGISTRNFDDAKTILKIEKLWVDMPGETVRNVNLEVKEGEILGIGGLAGQGKLGIPNGVMGLYDGYDRWKGSSAEMASILDLPVLLIVNARSMAYSAAAVIHGFTSLSCENLPSLRFAGVIFNQVGSERHASFLKQACEDAGTVCLGCIPRLPDMEIPSRHLGLSLENRDFIEQIICRAADAVEQYVDLKALGL